MDFVKSIYPGWDDRYATALLGRFYLRPEQKIKGLSRGEHVKALLLVLARRPRLLVLDEPTSGLDPVARHEVIAELMDVLQDEERSILFSSHKTLEVEQISDQITFIDRGRIVDSERQGGIRRSLAALEPRRAEPCRAPRHPWRG
jgi:ABC-2 type transport system ATP-binding protein